MIAFDFSYYRPDSLEEALELYLKLNKANKNPLYYSGGTEIITMGRRNDIYTEAVIDIKGIPECSRFEVTGNELITGAAVPLTCIAESGLFPLLGETSKLPADHTARSKITIGGNVCGKIVYREAVLGHLVAESKVMIYGKKGKRILPINKIFDRQMKLKDGDMLVQFITKMNYAKLPYICMKRTRQGEIGYPLISMAALKKGEHIRMAFSGVSAFPFRSAEMEKEINNKSVPEELRIEQAISHLPAPIFENIHGSAEYKRYVLKNMLDTTLKALGGGML
ncbi:MAG: FAD binding domain-containing protein [Caulobacteraceae bacterium]